MKMKEEGGREKMRGDEICIICMIPPCTGWRVGRLALFGGGAATDGVVKVDFEFTTGARLVRHDHLGMWELCHFFVQLEFADRDIYRTLQDHTDDQTRAASIYSDFPAVVFVSTREAGNL